MSAFGCRRACRRRFGTPGDSPLSRARTGRRRRNRHTRCRLPWREHRRIQEHRVLTHQPATRPIDLDQERYERLRDRIGRLELDDLAAVSILDGTNLYGAEENGPIKAVAGERIAR